MNSTVTAKYQTTIPKAVREKLGIAINDSLEWIVENGQVVVRPIHNDFLRYRASVKTGEGDIAADIQKGRKRRLERYR
jgi:AbrB family looped-hinge helix DNA binding protein